MEQERKDRVLEILSALSLNEGDFEAMDRRIRELEDGVHALIYLMETGEPSDMVLRQARALVIHEGDENYHDDIH